MNSFGLNTVKWICRSSRRRYSHQAPCCIKNDVDMKGGLPLVIVRHGQSTWNQQNIFIGMTDTPLTDDGNREARMAGIILKEYNFHFDVVYTSLLRRSTKTVWIVMQELGLEWVNVVKDWRLNERNYGALVGRNKKQCVEQYGKDQVKRWRRSWDEPPPPMSKTSEFYPYNDKRYKLLGINEDELPLCESLKDVTKRTSVFWDDVITPLLKQGKKIMIVGHENNLRSIIKRLDNISNTDILNVELPRAIPILYSLDKETLKPIKLEGHADYLNGRYLISQEALSKIADRDQRQVYDTDIKETLETSPFLGHPPKPLDVLEKKSTQEIWNIHKYLNNYTGMKIQNE